MADEAKAILFVGLRSIHRLGTIAPRILTEREVIMAEALGGQRPATLGQRITYLSGVVAAPGAYDVMLVGDTPVVNPARMKALPAWAEAKLKEKGWRVP